jgi:pentatricopeptide repeat protein
LWHLIQLIFTTFLFLQIVDCYHSLKRRSTVQPDYQNLLRILGQGGCLQAALEVLDDLKSRGVRPDLSAYNHAINAAAPGGAYVEAERLLEEIRTAGLAPNSVTYGTMIEVMGQGGRWEDAVGYFERYLEGGFEPTVATYQNLLLVSSRALFQEDLLVLLYI